MLRFALVSAVLCAVMTVQAADVSGQVAKLKDADPKVRQKALAELGKMGPAAKSAIPAILETLNDKTTWVTTKGLMALKDIGPDDSAAKAVMPHLAKFPDIRTLVVDVYVAMGEKATPHLIEALKDETTAEGACEALIQLGPKGKDAAKQLTEVSTKHKSKPVRDLAVKALKAVNK